jgi:hypothetical protein
MTTSEKWQKVKQFSARFNSHPPLVMVHLFKMHVSAGSDNFVKRRFPIRQRSLGPDL